MTWKNLSKELEEEFSALSRREEEVLEVLDTRNDRKKARDVERSRAYREKTAEQNREYERARSRKRRSEARGGAPPKTRFLRERQTELFSVLFLWSLPRLAEHFGMALSTVSYHRTQARKKACALGVEPPILAPELRKKANLP